MVLTLGPIAVLVGVCLHRVWEWHYNRDHLREIRLHQRLAIQIERVQAASRQLLETARRLLIVIAVLQAQLHVRRVRIVLVIVVARLRYELGDRVLRLDRADLAVDRIALLVQVLRAVSDLFDRLGRKENDMR